VEKDRADDWYDDDWYDDDWYDDDVPAVIPDFQQPEPEYGEIVQAPVTHDYISRDAAKAAALAHAGVAEADIHDYSCELEHDDGRVEYEIDFEAGAYEYSYDINAVTGEIIHSEKERED